MPEPPRPVLDTVVLRVMTFSHPEGIDILLQTLEVWQARFPAEVYAWDENELPLTAMDETLSELARGIRYAKQKIQNQPERQAGRYKRWLEHAQQLPRHRDRGRLIIDPLQVHELAHREALRAKYGIGRGEAACLVLAKRIGSHAVFLSSDSKACQAAIQLDTPYLTLQQLLERWIVRRRPPQSELQRLIEGMKDARFGLDDAFVTKLRTRLQDDEF